MIDLQQPTGMITNSGRKPLRMCRRPSGMCADSDVTRDARLGLEGQIDMART